MCARHIVAAGISRVVYIEPYPKSKAQELYGDSIDVDLMPGRPGFVSFQPFVGVAPRRYMDFFDMVKRKERDGKAVRWSMREASPRVRRFAASYRIIETYFMEVLAESFKSAGLEIAE